MKFTIKPVADSRTGLVSVSLDAGETLVRKTSELEMVETAVYNRYRPNIWRSIFPVRSDVPAWVSELSYDVIAQYAEFEATHKLGVNLPAANVDKSKGNVLRFYDFGSSYGYEADEMMRAQQLGIPLDTMRFEAVLKAADAKLETLAYAGAPQYGIGGLSTITGITTVTAMSKTGGGTTWTAAAKLEEIVTDCVAMVQGIVNATAQTSTPDTLVIPLARYQLLQFSRRHFADATNYPSDETGLQVLQRHLPGVTIKPWNKLTTTMYAFDSKDPEVIAMFVPLDPTALQAISTPWGGAKIPVKFRTGGLASKFPTAIAKMVDI